LNDIANDKALARLSALDRETVRFAKRLRLSTTDIDAFVKAADMGRLQEAPAKILKLRDALDGLGMAKEGAKLMDDTRTNAERLQERLERLKDLLNAGEIDWETYSRAVAKVRDEFGKAALAAAGLDNLGKEVGSAIAGSFKDAIREGKDLVGTLKDIGLKLSDIALNAAFKPVEKFLGSVFDNMFSGFMGGLLKSADGNVFTQGDVVPFASGGLVTRPTFFPMARGGVGLMGEAGPEAIMPLKRDRQGRLGVVSGGGNTAPVSITFNVTTPDAGSFTRSEGQITAMLNRAVARGRRGL
jgi:phage-related minor tail protein